MSLFEQPAAFRLSTMVQAWPSSRVRQNIDLAIRSPFLVSGYWFVVFTSSWLSTEVTPAVFWTSEAIVDCSSALLTGPRKVTLPSIVMILMFLAMVDNESLAMMALRTFRVVSRSASLLPWSPGVSVALLRSRSFNAVLSAFFSVVLVVAGWCWVYSPGAAFTFVFGGKG